MTEEQKYQGEVFMDIKQKVNIEYIVMATLGLDVSFGCCD